MEVYTTWNASVNGDLPAQVAVLEDNDVLIGEKHLHNAVEIPNKACRA